MNSIEQKLEKLKIYMLDKYCDLRIRFIIYMIVLFILSLLLAYLMGVPI